MNQPEDYIQQLANHIKMNLKKGYTLEALKFSLINQGYSRISVETAINRANQELAASVPEMKEKPQIYYKIEPEIPVKNGFWDWLRNIFG